MSNTLQPVKLFYEHHIANRDLAVIFVNTGCDFTALEGEGEDISEAREAVTINNYMKTHGYSDDEQAKEDFDKLTPEEKAEFERVSCDKITWNNA